MSLSPYLLVSPWQQWTCKQMFEHLGNYDIFPLLYECKPHKIRNSKFSEKLRPKELIDPCPFNYHDTITIGETPITILLLLRVLHHGTITVSKFCGFLMNLDDLSMSAISKIHIRAALSKSKLYHQLNILFTQSRSPSCFRIIFVWKDKFQNALHRVKIYRDKNYQNYWQLKALSAIVIDRWKHYHDSTIKANTITIGSTSIYRCIITALAVGSH